MSARTTLVVGAGGSLGNALCRTLVARGDRVVGIVRNTRSIDSADIDVREADLTTPRSIEAALANMPPIDALVYNAGQIDLASLADTNIETFTASWQVNTLGAFICAHILAPGMVARGAGAMAFIGATSSVRGGPRAHAFASAKHALRGLASSLAKELGPRGVHVSHLVIDGKIWGNRTRERFPDVTAEHCLDADQVARTIEWLLGQPSSAQTFEIDLRPHTERWS